MMWQTKVEIGTSPFKISYDDKVVFLGSCFAQEIGGTMAEMGLDVNVNPFGVLYNPASIASSLDRLSNPVPFTMDEIILNGDIYKSLAHSSEYSDMTANGLLTKIHSSLDLSSPFFDDSRVISV